jgi:micrococcal nuclease
VNPYVYRLKALVRVLDGDTIDIDLDLGFSLTLRQRIRLKGLDAPELTRPTERAAGEAAKAFVQAWLEPPGTIYIETTKDDKYGRMLGDFIREGQPSLCNALLAAGLARPYQN